MSEREAVGVAAFDVDGTLTRRDTLVPFLRRVAGSGKVARTLAASFPRLAMVAAGRASRDDAKEHLLMRLLAGRVADEVRAAGDDYAPEVLAQMRPEMCERLDWHRAEGHRVVLVSASADIYLAPVARRLGADLVCTRLAVDGAGLLTGRFDGANCRGSEKARRLLEWLGGADPELWAYGNKGGDDEMLAMADHPTLVKRGRAITPFP